MKSWFTTFFTSSIGKKTIMALNGLFLILFLMVHLAGNLQLLNADGGQAFNIYADFMAHNGLIQTISKGNFFFILLHSVLGVGLWIQNRAARGNEGYAVKKTRAATATNAGFAKNMWFLGVIIFVFVVVHLVQFWGQMKFGETGANVSMVDYEGQQVKNLYALVETTFTNLGFVVFYVVCMVIIAFHLWHGFQSAFQTLGWNHKKFSSVIKLAGKAYAVLVPAGFAIIPIVFYIEHGA